MPVTQKQRAEEKFKKALRILLREFNYSGEEYWSHLLEDLLFHQESYKGTEDKTTATSHIANDFVKHDEPEQRTILEGIITQSNAAESIKQEARQSFEAYRRLLREIDSSGQMYSSLAAQTTSTSVQPTNATSPTGASAPTTRRTAGKPPSSPTPPPTAGSIDPDDFVLTQTEKFRIRAIFGIDLTDPKKKLSCPYPERQFDLQHCPILAVNALLIAELAQLQRAIFETYRTYIYFIKLKNCGRFILDDSQPIPEQPSYEYSERVKWHFAEFYFAIAELDDFFTSLGKYRKYYNDTTPPDWRFRLGEFIKHRVGHDEYNNDITTFISTLSALLDIKPAIDEQFARSTPDNPVGFPTVPDVLSSVKIVDEKTVTYIGILFIALIKRTVESQSVLEQLNSSQISYTNIKQIIDALPHQKEFEIWPKEPWWPLKDIKEETADASTV